MSAPPEDAGRVLVRLIVALVGRPRWSRRHDPVAGSGAFLLAAARRGGRR